MSKQEVVEEIHKAARRNFIRRPVTLKGINDLWQADLIDIQSVAKVNKGYKYILVIIDCFSKFVWTAPVKTKTKSEITNAFQQLLNKSGLSPTNLQTDLGKEFYNNEFSKLMTLYKINHYSSYSTKKASIVERVIKTLKGKLYKYFSLAGNYKWVGNPLNSIVDSYNDTVHRVIKCKPKDVNAKNESAVLINIQRSWKVTAKGKYKFKPGDYVRISKYKGCFQKGYTPNWSTEIFLVTTVNRTNPVTYHIKDLHNQLILGSFYEQELQKTNHPDIYLVEKVLKRKGNKLFVKWLGLSENENSWIDKKAIV